MGQTTVHRALADERRAQIVDELRTARGGLDVQELARLLGLHANTVRFHLARLEEAGLVSSHPAERASPGRPRILYALRPSAAGVDRDEYRLLANVLAGAVAEGATPERAGHAWGRYLVERPLPLASVPDDEATAVVTALLDEQGFGPEAGDHEILMHRCPFHDLAETHPDVVCGVHRGLISGALEELGSDLHVEALDVFVEPDLCVARLSRTSA